MLQVLRSCKWPRGGAVGGINVTDSVRVGECNGMLSVVCPPTSFHSSLHHLHLLTFWQISLCPLKVSLNSLMNRVLKTGQFASQWFQGQVDAVFSRMTFPGLKVPVCHGPPRMEMHSWVRNEIASLWSVISCLGSHIVPGSLVQTIIYIMALILKKERKKSILWNVWSFKAGFSFSLMMKNTQCRIHSTVIRTLRYRIWEYSFIQ